MGLAPRVDVEANLVFVPTEQGGRKTPCRSGSGYYRPNCDFGLRAPNGEVLYNDILFEFIDKEWGSPGEAAQANAPRPEFLNGRLYPGYKFFVHEGHRLVANGEITKVINPSLLKDNLRE